MPLPDERPRQSVANLIGRFEQQNKRSSIVLPRSPSVLSQHTGDSVKTEGETKKEWPPVQFSPSISFSRPTPSVSASQQSIPQIESSESAPALSDPVKTPPKKRESIIMPDLQPQQPESPPKQTAAPPSSFKIPKTTTGARPSLPIKPQTTGGSTASVRKTTSTRSTPSTPAKSTPSTPSRNTTAQTRAKTPSTSRPKTPSSGLFAPTAASLAKARNAQPQVPTPVKKTPLSSTVADRLSKPTAASLSKARAPPAASTRGKPPARGAAPKGTKPRAPVKTKEKVEKSAVAEPRPAEQVPDHINGHSFEPSQSTEGDDQEEEADVSHVDDYEETVTRDDDHGEMIPQGDHAEVEAAHEAEVEEPGPEEDALHDEPSESHANSESLDLASEKTGNDIEDMVNFLEAPAPIIRPSSAASIPEEVKDIPDEE